jgi:uncharacterized delta-60 repeat protein
MGYNEPVFRSLIAAAVFATLLVARPNAALAGEAGLDPTFGAGGRVVSDFGQAKAFAEAAALAPDGSVVVSGGSCSPSSGGERACRSFFIHYGRDGAERRIEGSDRADGDVVPTFIVIDSHGRIVGVGSDPSRDDARVLVRYLPDGRMDRTLPPTPLPSEFGVSEIQAIAIDSEDRVLLAGPGDADAVYTTALRITRLLPSGKPDSSFGDDGVVDVPGSPRGYVSEIVPAPRGTIYVAGFAENPSTGHVGNPIIEALDPTGQPVSSFSPPIRRFTDTLPGASGMALDSRGRLLVTLEGNADAVMPVIRLLPDGSLDDSFGRDGMASLPPCKRRCYGSTGIAVDAADRPLLIDRGFALARYTEAGEPDASFAPQGSTSTGFGKDHVTSALHLVIDGSGRPVVVGTRTETNGRLTPATDAKQQIVLARYGAPSCRIHTATIVGTPGDDRLVGTSGRDVFLAGAGDDRVIAGDGRDLACAGAGGDRVRLDAGHDRAYGQAGVDKLLGGPGRDFLHGGPGRDLLRDGVGRDRLYRQRNDGGPPSPAALRQPGIDLRVAEAPATPIPLHAAVAKSAARALLAIRIIDSASRSIWLSSRSRPSAPARSRGCGRCGRSSSPSPGACRGRCSYC